MLRTSEAPTPIPRIEETFEAYILENNPRGIEPLVWGHFLNNIKNVKNHTMSSMQSTDITLSRHLIKLFELWVTVRTFRRRYQDANGQQQQYRTYTFSAVHDKHNQYQ